MKYYLLLLTFFTFLSTHAWTSNDNANLAFLSEFIDPGSLVFDIGAHVGSKAQLYRSFGGRVVCLEPQPACCEQLNQRFKDDPMVTIIPKGVASKTGILRLSICSEAKTISTFSYRWKENSRFTNQYNWDEMIDVEVLTLDDLIKSFGTPQFCKIDVEHYEYEVLLGLHSPIPYISFEAAFEVFDSTILCIEYLESLGYCSFNFAFGEEPALVSDKWLSGKEVINLIQRMGKQDPMVWGDIYARY